MLSDLGAKQRESIFFSSDRVNGGQAITHGKELSSCTLAARRPGNAVTASQTHRDRGEIRQKELSLQSGIAGRFTNKIAERRRRKGVRLEKRLSHPFLSPTWTRSPRS